MPAMNELGNITIGREKVKGFTAKKMTWDKILVWDESNFCQYESNQNYEQKGILQD
jgi:hypothetical protein